MQIEKKRVTELQCRREKKMNNEASVATRDSHRARVLDPPRGHVAHFVSTFMSVFPVVASQT